MVLRDCRAPGAAREEMNATLSWPDGMIDRCYEFAESIKSEGRPLVGIMCEFTPREIILAAGAVPVCLCGGSVETIPAAERILPADLCPLIKSTFGYYCLKSNPFLEWADLVVAETTCDGKKKMFELMSATKQVYLLQLPHKIGDPESLEHWTGQVRKFKQYLEQRYRVQITEDGLRDAIRLMNRERGLRRRLADLMRNDTPPLTGRHLLGFRSVISGIESDLQAYEQAIQVLTESVSSRGRADRGVQTRVPIRALMTGVPLVHGAERVLDLIESSGLIVVAMENCTGLKPILEDVDLADPDPLRAIALKYFHLPCSVMTVNTRRFDSLRALVGQFRPDCVIELIWQACLTYDVESFQVRKLVEDEFRLPYLRITTDYSPSDSARITARLEALVETIRSKTRP